MARKIQEYAGDIAQHLQNTGYTLQRMEYLLREGVIVNRDIEQVYFGLYMDAITAFESMLEDLFLRLLVEGRIDHKAYIVPQVKFKSLSKARANVFRGNNYVNWLPYEHYTLERAYLYFRGGRPFSKLDNDIDIPLLRELHLIRNALAHSSDHAQNQFLNKVLASYSVSTNEKTPIKFLRSIHRKRPLQRKYDMYVIQITDWAYKICDVY